ncbi:MAG: disulfide oxidoreductase [Rhodobacterales bacterium]|nr:disulfide oxidoreductase [Rhodobacterales bacterium]
MRARSKILQGRTRVTAVLGPTNTGKTHRAIQAMLAHSSGMIGLPLRLLAREVYDRVVAVKGLNAVALITGEQKIVPPEAAYFVCTVEAMPIARPVAFLAVDEIQLAGDRNRGHVFTDRILNARGVLETMFLGSDTIAPLLQALIPYVRIERQPRLSQLRWSGVLRLARVPRRSAVVAFSVKDVYAHAEKLRALHGGVALVWGALSPRTRNAQVAMYQAGEVQHLVATDAIGMGLNLDVRHVSFAGLRKFDGRRPRALRLDEIGQIAGRAGRYTTDGTFGTLREVGAIDPEEIYALENHQFTPLTRLYWRNSTLSFESVLALQEGLARPPNQPGLILVRDEDDQRALADLSGREGLPLNDEAAVRRLWDVCRIPDFRKTMTGSHGNLLYLLARHLLNDGVLPESLLAERLGHLDHTDGDLDLLMTRMAYIRTWTYITHQRSWLANAPQWQARAGEIEDRLSDALHERLQKRFVDQRAVIALTQPDAPVTVDDQGVVRLGSHVVGHQVGMGVDIIGGIRSVDRAVRRGLSSFFAVRIAELVNCPDQELEWSERGFVRWRDGVLGTVTRGPHLLEPKIGAARLDLLTPSQRDQVRHRLQRWVQSQVAQVAVAVDSESSTVVRGLCYAVGRGMGCVPATTVRAQLKRLTKSDRKWLAKLRVRTGTQVVYAESLLTQPLVAVRAQLYAVWSEEALRSVPNGAPSSFAHLGAPQAWIEAVGYLKLGRWALRVDVFEALAGSLRGVVRKGGNLSGSGLTNRLKMGKEDAVEVIRQLGYGAKSAGEEVQVWRKQSRRRR